MPNPGYPASGAYGPSRPAPTPTMFELVLRILAGVWVELTLTCLLLAPAVLWAWWCIPWPASPSCSS